MNSLQSKKRILVLDDLAIFREPIALALEAEGYKVATASDGKEALHLVESLYHFDVMIVDYSMPEMDGIAFLQRALQYPHTAHAHVIMLTDSADREVVLGARQLGISDYLLKSAFSMSALLAKVSDSLASSNERGTSAPAGGSIPSAAHPESSTSSTADDSPLEILRAHIHHTPMSIAVRKLLLSEEGAIVEDIGPESLVAADPTLAERMIEIASATPMGRSRGRRISMSEAMALLGITTVRAIAAWVHFYEGQKATGSLRKWLRQHMQHSLAVATAMEQLVPGDDKAAASNRFTLGLFYNIPEMILGATFPNEYLANAQQEASTGHHLASAPISGMLSIPYTQVIELVFNELRIPTDLLDATLTFFNSPPSSSAQSLVTAGQLALARCVVAELGYQDPPPSISITCSTYEEPQLAEMRKKLPDATLKQLAKELRHLFPLIEIHEDP